jgi:iron complex outermembrane receptor protein
VSTRIPFRRPMSHRRLLSAVGAGRGGIGVVLACAAASILPGVVSASEPLEEVVITARLRPTVLAETPVSATVLDAQTLRNAGVQHLQDVLGLVPNLNWASGTSRPRHLQLRGIGETDQWQGAPNPSVGFLIDGMDFSGVGMPATLLDLGQVEVLRGPQGTTLGANALAGLINLTTAAPRPEPLLRVESTAGGFGTLALGAVFGGAIGQSDGSSIDGSGGGSGGAWRAVLQRHRSDGSRRNITLGRDDTNGLDERTLRLRAAFAPSAGWQADLSTLWVEQDNGFDAFAIDNSRVTRSDDPGRDRQRSRGFSLSVERAGVIALRSVTAVADADIVYSFDGDWGADPDYDFTSRFLRGHRTITQDLRWTSDPADRSAGWDWTAGLYGSQVDERNDQLDLYGGEVYRALVSDYRSRTVAAYGNIQHHLSSRWRAGLGLRLERRSIDYADTDGSALAPAETMWGGDATLEYRPAEGSFGYLSLSRGYKGGGFNLGAAIPAERRVYDAEGLYSLELGWKHTDRARGLTAELALFHMWRRQQQVSTSAQVDPGDPLSFIYLTDNAARGANYGLEAALAWRPTERVTLQATAALLRSPFTEYRVGTRDLSGRDQAHAPRAQYSLGLDWRGADGPFLRADLQHAAAFYFSDSHDQRASACTQAALRGGYETGRWSASVWLRNALDDDCAQRGFFFGNEPPDFPDKLYVQKIDPRQAGLTVSWTLR